VGISSFSHFFFAIQRKIKRTTSVKRQTEGGRGTESERERWRLWIRRKNNASAVENDRHNDYPVFKIILKDFIKTEL